MKEIEDWLKGSRNFQEGKILYSKFGSHQSVLATLSTLPPGKMADDFLADHLGRILKQFQRVETVTQPQTSIIAKPGKSDCSVYRAQANAIYVEMAAMHSRLLAYTTDEMRANAYKAIVDRLQPAWAEAAYIADYFDEFGTLPPEPLKKQKKVTKTDKLSAGGYKRLCLLRSKVTRALNEQIPKYRQHPEKNAAKLAKRLAEVEEWKKEIEKLENGYDN